MKQINKGTEPLEFSTWKAKDKMKHRPKWERVPTHVKKIIHFSLLREQGFICCYCEIAVTSEDSHIEHFRPKRFSDQRLNYGNLHCSCQRDILAGEPRHCGNKKCNWFNDDLLISPLDTDCENRFKFTGDGRISPALVGDDAAKKTVDVLGLDLPKLRALRAAAIDALIDLSAAEIQHLIGRGNDNSYFPFHTTICQVLL